jgi:hypothetical protein
MLTVNGPVTKIKNEDVLSEGLFSQSRSNNSPFFAGHIRLSNFGTSCRRIWMACLLAPPEPFFGDPNGSSKGNADSG